MQVRTTGRALDDGGLDDLVGVESVKDRRRFTARVSGYQELEVFARGPSVSSGL